MKKLLLISAILLTVGFLQSETLVGQIRQEQSEKLLSDVTVYIPVLNRGTISDNNGRFVFQDLPAGKYLIRFSRLGFQTLELEIEFPKENFLNIYLRLQPQAIEGLKVSSNIAVQRKTPVTFSNLEKDAILAESFGQDLPMLISEMPNVFSYADAGNPLGYSYLKIRGFDQKRIGVMINGIPLNDPEDHQVYWIDMPDFAESTSEIQFQRGVGNSQYGVSSFGGSLNLETNHLLTPIGSELFTNFGSYNTIRYGLKTTQNFLDYIKFNLRLSGLQSDGYRQNSATEQWSYFLNLSRMGERHITELNLYGGKEITHAAWYASSAADLSQNHQHNPISYDNEIDQFSQPHTELHHQYIINDSWLLKNTLFYISGEGFYEQLKTNRDLWDYGLAEEADAVFSDLIRQKWVKKNHLGWIGNLNWKHLGGDLTIGSYVSYFDSDHWGEIKDVLEADSLNLNFSPGWHYYRYLGEKKYISFYLNELYQPFPDLFVMLNLYYQNIRYDFAQKSAGNFAGEYLHSYDVDYNFFNPRFGINFNLNEAMNIYANVSMAQREPADDELFDIWDGPDDLGANPLFACADTVYVNDQIDHIKWSDPYIKPEKLLNYEIGFGYDAGNWKVKTNFFWMDFQNEIVGYGGVDDDGNPIRGNAEKTIHRGVEFEAEKVLPKNFFWRGNVSYNDNYFHKFVMKDWDDNWNVIEVDYSGNKIGGFPDVLASTTLGYYQQKFQSNLQIQHVGKQYLDNSEDENRTVKPFQLLNLNIAYELSDLIGSADISLIFKVNNLLDKKYETAGYYDSWEEEKYYFPGAGRNFVAAARVKF